MDNILKNRKIEVKGREVALLTSQSMDYISLTDIAKHRNETETFSIINNWMRSRSTIEFIGLWEIIHNPDFKPIEFERFRIEAGSNYFVLSPKRWQNENPDKEGNIRDAATIEQLVVLSNLESINAVMIHQGTEQSVRLQQLNRIAIMQMRSLLQSRSVKKLK